MLDFDLIGIEYNYIVEILLANLFIFSTIFYMIQVLIQVQLEV